MSRKQAFRDRDALEAMCNTLVDDLLRRLDLGWVTITNKFDMRSTDDRIICEAYSDFQYRQATLQWNLEAVKLSDPDDLLLVAIHELVHVLIDPLFGSLTDEESSRLEKMNELATENVARAIISALNA